VQPRDHLRLAGIALATLLCAACASTTPRAATDAAADLATPGAVGMVDIRELVPDIDTDIRYAGSDNFTDTRVDGYEAAKCYLLRPAAEALAGLERALRPQGLRLRVFDCYRPERAVRQFVRWAADPRDQSTKPAYYPALEKASLVPGYIADRSGHSKGATVDLTLLRCDGSSPAHCEALDMGTPFDFFDSRANTDHPNLDEAQRTNRARLLDAMTRHGFDNYPMEWWHYTFRLQPPPDTFHDVPIR
jgi:D-alanyl-D-alanine dipeptidase